MGEQCNELRLTCIFIFFPQMFKYFLPQDIPEKVSIILEVSVHLRPNLNLKSKHLF